MRKFRLIITLSFSLLAITQLVVGSSSVYAISKSTVDSLGTSSEYWWPDQGGVCATASTLSSPQTNTGTDTTPTATAAPTNKDYAGRQILTDAQLTAIQQNQSVYQQAASQVGIPWQMIAVIHLRESGLKLVNPSNGQGIYQVASGAGGPYPAGPIDQAEFLRQSVFIANFIKGKAAGNYAAHKSLSTNSDAETVKDTFFSYNGRAGAYINQAASLGYDPNTQGYEGSPYVMNKADAKRDPGVSGATWGQIKTDGGGIVYPANNDYGAFVEYGALAGIQSGNCSAGTVNCTSTSDAAATGGISPLRQKVVCLMEQELQQWKGGQIKPGFRPNSADSFSKYSQNSDELWCADFVSWIYNQAGYPLKDGGGWRLPGVAGIDSVGRANGKFHWHAPGGYTPRPGDIVIHGGNQHVNIVDSYTNGKLTMIGGDQGNPAYKGNPDLEYPDYSVVSSDTYEINDITAYVSPD